MRAVSIIVHCSASVTLLLYFDHITMSSDCPQVGSVISTHSIFEYVLYLKIIKKNLIIQPL